MLLQFFVVVLGLGESDSIEYKVISPPKQDLNIILVSYFISGSLMGITADLIFLFNPTPMGFSSGGGTGS